MHLLFCLVIGLVDAYINVLLIYRLDVGLQEVSQLNKQSAEWEDFLSEMSGQLFFLIGTLLFKRAAKVYSTLNPDLFYPM